VGHVFVSLVVGSTIRFCGANWQCQPVTSGMLNFSAVASGEDLPFFFLGNVMIVRMWIPEALEKGRQVCRIRLDHLVDRYDSFTSRSKIWKERLWQV